MLDAALKALSQMFSPPFRSVLLKSIGAAAVLLIVIGITVQRLIAWGAGSGEQWLETTIGPVAHMPLTVVFWILSVAAALGLFAGGLVLRPAGSPTVAGLFRD